MVPWPGWTQACILSHTKSYTNKTSRQFVFQTEDSWQYLTSKRQTACICWILPQANWLIGVKYSQTLHIPLLLMKRPPPPGRLHTESTHCSLLLWHAQNNKLRKPRGLQVNPEGFQTQMFKYCEASGYRGLGNCKSLLQNQTLRFYPLWCLLPMSWSLARACSKLPRFVQHSRTLQAGIPQKGTLGRRGC